MPKIVTVQEAVSHIKDDDVLAISGMLFVAGCEPFYEALEERFLTSGAPRNLTMFAASSIGSSTKFIYGLQPDLANRLAHDGLVTKIITSLYNTMPSFHAPIVEGRVGAYIVPQGTFSQMISSAARRLPRTLTKMGLHTFVDPRYGGGKLNDVSMDDLCDVIEIDGEEFLSYKTIYPDVCIIRGTTIDINGNITMEEECGEFDALQLAMATRLNGGKVIVQVKRQSDERADPQLVKLPAQLVDLVYVHKRQSLTLVGGKYDPRLTGRELADDAVLDKAATYIDMHSQEKQAVLQRACEELYDGAVVNLGAGLPCSIAMMARRMGKDSGVTFTNEIGLWGGITNPQNFGLNFNTDIIMSQHDIQNYYEGAGLDIAFAGALEVDVSGNVNVTRIGKRVFGTGGFNSITHNSKKLVFCFNFLGRNGKCKIVDSVGYINYNADRKPNYQRVLYITDRCVFELDGGRLRLVELMPNYSISDVLPHLPEGVLFNDKEF